MKAIDIETDIEIDTIWTSTLEESDILVGFIESKGNKWPYEFTLETLNQYEESLGIHKGCREKECSYFNNDITYEETHKHYKLHSFFELAERAKKYINIGYKILCYKY